MQENQSYGGQFYNKAAKQKVAKMPRRDPYRLNDQRMEYQLFASDYFSAADAKIYLGDVWIDDCVAFNYSMSEEAIPVYGYNSFTYDAIARGKRLVQGNFAINFKSVGYLKQVLENADAIAYAIEEGKNKKLIDPKYYEELKLNEILLKLGKKSFDQIADEFETAIWGNDDNAGYLSSDLASYFPSSHYGFDIRIQYGAVQEKPNLTFAPNTHEDPAMTVEVINGVQFTGMTKSIGTSDQGAPILESYSFLARDINGVSLESLKIQELIEEGAAT